VDVPGEGNVRNIADLLRRGQRRADAPFDTDAAGADADHVRPTRVLSKVLAALRSYEAPVLLDLGPVVGANVTFLGERLGCKIFVEDLFTDLDRLTRQGGGEPYSVRSFLRTRLTQASASVDGILCWDLLEYLEPDSVAVLASDLTRILRPGGVLFAFFRTEWRESPGHTKYEIVDEQQLRYRPCAGARSRQRVLPSREVIRAFERLVVAESFLLQIGMREMLFRKARGGTA
jgi:hypothetical protein